MRPALETVSWNPPRAYDLALEVMRISELRRRAPALKLRKTQRIGFFHVLGVTEGTTEHLVDFTPQPAGPGTWLVLRPGQVQRFDFSRSWDGWLIVFRPELLLPGDSDSLAAARELTSRGDELGTRIQLGPEQHALCCASARQMQLDAALDAPARARNALLFFQIHALLLRLGLSAGPPSCDPRPAARAALVARLRRLVDDHVLERRDLAWYAAALGCSERSLARACRAVTGLSAKRLIVERAALEAKRLLAHTSLSIQAVGEALGYGEASNFAKFFKRESGSTPSRFRASTISSARTGGTARPASASSSMHS